MPLALLLLCILLAGVIYVETAQPEMEASPAAHAKIEPPREAEPGFAMAPLASYAEVISRPLFTATRRPGVNTPINRHLTAFMVVGIIVTPKERHALVSHGVPPQVERVVVGQALEGWTVKEIQPDKIVIAQGDTQLDVKPAEKPTPPAGNAAIAEARAPPFQQSATTPIRSPLIRAFNKRH